MVLQPALQCSEEGRLLLQHVWQRCQQDVQALKGSLAQLQAIIYAVLEGAQVNSADLQEETSRIHL
jgi:hypothetical protein